MNNLFKTFKDSNYLRSKVFILIALSLLLSLLYPKANLIVSDVEIGGVWLEDDIIADKPFPILKDEIVYINEVEAAKKSVFPIFDKIIIDYFKVKDSLNLVLNNFASIPEDNLIVSKPNYRILKKLDNNNKKKILAYLNLEFDKIRNFKIINFNKSDLNQDSILVKLNKYEEVVPLKEVYDVNTIKSDVYEKFIKVYPNNPEIIVAIIDYFDYFVKPNLIYNSSLTKLEEKNVIQKISKNSGIVLEKEKIVSKHEKITPEIKQKIISYKIIKNQDANIGEKTLIFIGKFLQTLSILLIFSIYIFIFRKKIYSNNLLLLMISIIILLISLQTYFITEARLSSSFKYLIFIPVASMLLTILFDSRVGFYSTVIISIIQSGLRGNDYYFLVTSIFTGALSVYTVRNIINRKQIFRSFFFILLGYFVSIVAVSLQRQDTYEIIRDNIIFAFTNSLLSPILTYGLTIFFERIFNITTDLTYLELSDFTNPGLREIQTDAPGTFMHSLVLSSMVELAAEKINANPLLAKVGALYHDIGKTFIPQYFIENQTSTDNIHDNLDPYESAKILRAHVEQGIKKAETLNLPQSIIDFIPMHHGTMIMKFFYEKAKQLYPDKVINEEDFRYNGPKPNTKETAILMLADACESTTRSLKEKNEEIIRNVVENIFKLRIDDGQLDESPLTFSEIKIVKEVFISCLVGQNHKRIEYPHQKEIQQPNLKV